MLLRFGLPAGRLAGFAPSFAGPFGFQPNNTTRVFEYPWAFFATPLAPGLRVLEIGGGLSGFQFVLDRCGCRVVNVDPGLEARGRGWQVDKKGIGRLNQAFGTDITLFNCVLEDAALEPETFDRIFSISVLEHVAGDEVQRIMAHAFNLLKPGGYFIMTLDLFLNLVPFCAREKNEFGSNVSVRALAESAPFELMQGDRTELYGYPEFSVDKILSLLDELVLGEYPALAQLVVLQKPGTHASSGRHM